MPNPMVAVVAAQVGSSVMNKNSAKNAAKTEAKAAQAGIDLQRETRDMSLANLRPFMNAGAGALNNLKEAAGQKLDPSKFYNEYFDSPEYAQLSDQASRNILASREATGGLRTTSSANLLSSIAPQLAQSAFARQQALQDAAYNRQMGLVNVGLNAAGGSNAAAGNSATNMTNLMLQKGQAVAGGQAAGAQAFNGLANNLLSLYAGSNNQGGF